MCNIVVVIVIVVCSVNTIAQMKLHTIIARDSLIEAPPLLSSPFDTKKCVSHLLEAPTSSSSPPLSSSPPSLYI